MSNFCSSQLSDTKAFSGGKDFVMLRMKIRFAGKGSWEIWPGITLIVWILKIALFIAWIRSKELFMLNGQGRIMAISVVIAPTTLFS